MTSPIINMVTRTAEQFQAIALAIRALRKAMDTMVAEEIFVRKKPPRF